MTGRGRRGARSATLPAVLLAVLAATMAAGRAPAGAASPPAAHDPVPVLAYHYIWFNPSSWNRAKTDYPLLGRYSSSDVTVMRRQVDLAKKAGVTGFLVSWKTTPLLDERLETLVRVSADAGFNLGIVFQGLDFYRLPLPMTEVRASFDHLARTYADDPVFDLFGKPVVIWSGTWKYTRRQIASITDAYRSRLKILASEKHPADYEQVAGLFDGNAYYWSSVDPLRTPRYREKLASFSSVVHRNGGLWVAPASPGFDARLVGGSRVIPRRDGETLRAAMNAAVASSPDAVGLISWNEYSENTMVEPSREHGKRALEVIASLAGADPAAIPDFDSSSPSGQRSGIGSFFVIAALAAILLGSAGAIARRGRAG